MFGAGVEVAGEIGYYIMDIAPLRACGEVP
jgi:hypothetical protein